MPQRPTWTIAASLALTLLASGACDQVDRYLAGVPEDRLAEAALARWSTPGSPFLDGVTGRDTVASVSATGARARLVAVIPLEGGAPTIWSLEVTRVETYPTFSGEAFGRYLTERGRHLGVGAPIPDPILSRMADGTLLGVGEVEVRYGPSIRSARTTESRAAFLVHGPGADAPTWQIQDESAPARVLLATLRTVADDMIEGDGQVRSCLGDAGPAGATRSAALACVRKAWEEAFGPRE